MMSLLDGSTSHGSLYETKNWTKETGAELRTTLAFIFGFLLASALAPSAFLPSSMTLQSAIPIGVLAGLFKMRYTSINSRQEPYRKFMLMLLGWTSGLVSRPFFDQYCSGYVRLYLFGSETPPLKLTRGD